MRPAVALDKLGPKLEKILAELKALFVLHKSSKAELIPVIEREVLFGNKIRNALSLVEGHEPIYKALVVANLIPFIYQAGSSFNEVLVKDVFERWQELIAFFGSSIKETVGETLFAQVQELATQIHYKNKNYEFSLSWQLAKFKTENSKNKLERKKIIVKLMRHYLDQRNDNPKKTKKTLLSKDVITALDDSKQFLEKIYQEIFTEQKLPFAKLKKQAEYIKHLLAETHDELIRSYYQEIELIIRYITDDLNAFNIPMPQYSRLNLVLEIVFARIVALNYLSAYDQVFLIHYLTNLLDHEEFFKSDDVVEELAAPPALFNQVCFMLASRLNTHCLYWLPSIEAAEKVLASAPPDTTLILKGMSGSTASGKISLFKLANAKRSESSPPSPPPSADDERDFLSAITWIDDAEYSSSSEDEDITDKYVRTGCGTT